MIADRDQPFLADEFSDKFANLNRNDENGKQPDESRMNSYDYTMKISIH